MQLGAFSIRLAVKDIRAPKAFYEKSGFAAIGGDMMQNWLILKNGDVIVGLFQGMFDKDMLTFNPGWDQTAKEIAKVTDARELPRALKKAGVTPMTEADETTKGPTSFIAVDSDGNPILVGQHR